MTTDKKYLNYIGIVFVGILFWTMSSSLPMIMDDNEENNEENLNEILKSGNRATLNVDRNNPINSLYEAVVSQYNHYFLINGRAIIHTIVQCFSGFIGKSLFDIISAVFSSTVFT